MGEYPGQGSGIMPSIGEWEEGGEGGMRQGKGGREEGWKGEMEEMVGRESREAK